MANKTKLILIVLLGCTIAACNNREKLVKAFPKKIVGRWVLDNQMMVMNAFDDAAKKDTTAGQEAGYKPAEIEYGSEGTYLLIIKDLNDDIRLRRPGKWEFSYDTLLLKDLNSGIITEQYIVNTLTDSTLEMALKIDFDDDGAVDDLYTGFYKKIVR